MLARWLTSLTLKTESVYLILTAITLLAFVASLILSLFFGTGVMMTGPGTGGGGGIG